MTTKTFRKRRHRALLLTAALTAVTAAFASASPSPPRVSVDWTDPTKFAEVRDSPSMSASRRWPTEWLDQLATHLQRRADRVLPPGDRLSVTFTDIKRAGTFEPWRGPRWDDVRIVKDLYPPRIDLHFTLTDADGHVLREGQRTLRDPAFLTRGIADPSDPLRYEKRLLSDWLKKEFGSKTGPTGSA